MEYVKINFESSDLASRHLGAAKRAAVVAALNSSKNIHFDLTDVETISDSFADELFGVLSQDLGVENFYERTKVINSNDYCLHAIARAILRRSKGMNRAA